jgi:hypothetical protein
VDDPTLYNLWRFDRRSGELGSAGAWHPKSPSMIVHTAQEPDLLGPVASEGIL